MVRTWENPQNPPRKNTKHISPGALADNSFLNQASPKNTFGSLVVIGGEPLSSPNRKFLDALSSPFWYMYFALVIHPMAVGPTGKMEKAAVFLRMNLY